MGLGLVIYGFGGVLMLAVSLPLIYDKVPMVHALVALRRM